MVIVEEIPHIINQQDLEELQFTLAQVDNMERKGNKIKVLLSSIWYPMCIAAYWRRALERRDDIDLKVVGSYTGTWIPWKGGMNLPAKYAVVPDIVLPHDFSHQYVDYFFAKSQLGDWKPDLNLTVDSTRNWVSKPSDGFVATIATDAHCIDYSHQRTQVDKFFNMHQRYAQPSDYILPYAFDPSCHYKEDVEKKYDVSMVGVEYGHRIELANRLKAEGISVYFSNGEVFDEYRTATSQAHVGINWSSQDDLNARAFELPAMGVIMVTNRVNDMGLSRHGYFDYAYQFEGANEADHSHKSSCVTGAVEQVKRVLSSLSESQRQADKLHDLIQTETYDNRVEELLQVCGFI